MRIIVIWRQSFWCENKSIQITVIAGWIKTIWVEKEKVSVAIFLKFSFLGNVNFLDVCQFKNNFGKLLPKAESPQVIEQGQNVIF